MKADYILKSEAVFDPLSMECFSGGVAVNGGRIAGTFRDGEDITELCGPGTKILSFGSRLLMPAFIDSHTHMFYGALALKSADLVEPETEEETARAIYDFAGNSADEWVFGFGWNQHYWKEVKLPSRTSLDVYFPDRPVVAVNEEMHSLWANTKALELSGFFSDSLPRKVAERIQRDETGAPSGYLLEEEEMSIVFERAFRGREGMEEALLKDYIKEMNRVGIGAVSNIQCHGILNDRACQSLDEAGGLDVRIGLVPSAHLPLAQLLDMRDRFTSPNLWFSGVKAFVDGTPMAYTGYLNADYEDRPGFRGEPCLTKGTFLEKAIALDKEEMRIRLHACGDGAVREALDIYEGIQKENGRRDSRHTIEHVEVIHPEDLERFARLGVVASVQPEHLSCRIFAEHPFHGLLGSERCRYAYPIRSFLDRNVCTAFGSDNPIVELNPMKGIYRAVTRRARDKMPREGWNPQEKISVAQALAAYTYGSACQLFRENELGSLRPGSYADLIVLDRNLFGIDAEEILEARVLLSMSGGRIVHEE